MRKRLLIKMVMIIKKVMMIKKEGPCSCSSHFESLHALESLSYDHNSICTDSGRSFFLCFANLNF